MELVQAPGQAQLRIGRRGTSHHLAGELFKQQTKTFITHIPYRGAARRCNDLIAGNVDMMFDGLGSSAASHQGGRIRALMVSGASATRPSPTCPAPPRLGLPDYTVTLVRPGRQRARRPMCRPAAIEIRKAAQRPTRPRPSGPAGAEFPNHRSQFAASSKMVGDQGGRRWSRHRGAKLGEFIHTRSIAHVRSIRLHLAEAARVARHALPIRPSSTPCRAPCGASCACVQAFSSTSDVRCVLIVGRRGAFCAGATSPSTRFRFDPRPA